MTHGLAPELLGGIEIHVEQLARELGKRHDIEVLCPVDDKGLPYFTEQSWRPDLGQILLLRWSAGVATAQLRPLFYSTGD